MKLIPAFKNDQYRCKFKCNICEQIFKAKDCNFIILLENKYSNEFRIYCCPNEICQNMIILAKIKDHITYYPDWEYENEQP